MKTPGSESQVRLVAIHHPRGHEVVVGGYLCDPVDPNDHPFELPNQVTPAELPQFVDLRKHMTTVEDQGHLGACTANAIAGAYEYLEKRTIGLEGDVSRLFIYYMERKLEGTVEEDAGATLRDGMKVLHKFGACNETLWPYDIAAFRTAPSDKAVEEAKRHTIDQYIRVAIDLHAMKTCLASGYPFVFGTKLFSSFQGIEKDGRIPLPAASEKVLGGHALLACGYSEHDQMFVVRNSWGGDWGDHGYCYFPYAYLTKADWTHDAWTLRRAHNLDFTVHDEIGKRGQPHSFFSTNKSP